MKKADNIKESFGYAKEGFFHCLRQERNFRIHLIFGLIAILLGAFIDLPLAEFAIVLLLIGVVLFAEMINTALENLVNMVTEEYHPLAKIVKDIAAGAVLFLCIVAVLIGILLYAPHIFALIIK